jgi:transcriptional regulator
MHPAPVFRVQEEATLLAFLAARPFVTLAATVNGRMLLAHTPVIARRIGASLVLDFHLSRRNALAEHLATGFAAAMVALGPNAYISPDWYESADQVPAWNYVSVEADGPVALLDETGLVTLLDDLSAQEEGRLAPKPPWTRAKMSPGAFERMTRAIIGARLTVERLEGTFKLGQNKSPADLAGAVRGLGDDPVARLMRQGGIGP